MRRIERAEARAAARAEAEARRAAVAEADRCALDAQKAQHQCGYCGGVGRRLVRGGKPNQRRRSVAIIICPDCDGKGVKPTLDQQVREAAAKVWRKSNAGDPVPDWLLK